MKITYKPEIDGLRTIAVLAVVIYHAQISFGDTQLLKGGLVGVDVFFVISGFLITSIILQEYQQTGAFSFTNFYERRARRLLPALFVVILASLPFAWHLLLPLQLLDFSKSILSSLIFGSNVYWDQTLQEYGAESALLKPFLHTWSLAVEEQYYIVYPILLISLYRWVNTRTIATLTIVIFLSLLLAETTTADDPSFSFYMLPTRFWELLCGGLLANIMFFLPLKEKKVLLNRAMPILGLFLIIYSMIFIDFDSSHPGFITLIPVIGTIFIIWFADENYAVTKLLSTKLFVGIGFISYSFYLWHYPIFAFGRYLDPKPTWDNKILWIILALTLSSITYFLVEKPFRKKTRVSRKDLIIYLTVALTIISSVNIFWIKNDGFNSRLDYLNSVLKNSSRIWVTKDGQKCHSGGGGRTPAFQLSESCVFEYSSDSKYMIVIGDSHAASLAQNLRILAKANSYNFIQLTGAGCAHIKDIHPQGVCAQRANQLSSYLKKYPDSVVVYSSRVPLFLELERFVSDEGDIEDNYKRVSKSYKKAQFPIRAKALIDSLNELRINSEKLAIVYPVPEQGFHVKDRLFRNYRLVRKKEMMPIITTSYDKFKDRVKSSYQTLDRVTGDNVYRVYPESAFCHEESGRCIVSERNKIFFGWDNHVSPLGSRLIVTEIANTLNLKVSPFGSARNSASNL